MLAGHADDHPEFAGAAAHYFRNCPAGVRPAAVRRGAPGRVAPPLDELLLDNFVKALYVKLKQKKSTLVGPWPVLLIGRAWVSKTGKHTTVNMQSTSSKETRIAKP